MHMIAMQLDQLGNHDFTGVRPRIGLVMVEEIEKHPPGIKQYTHQHVQCPFWISSFRILFIARQPNRATKSWIWGPSDPLFSNATTAIPRQSPRFASTT